MLNARWIGLSWRRATVNSRQYSPWATTALVEQEQAEDRIRRVVGRRQEVGDDRDRDDRVGHRERQAVAAAPGEVAPGGAAVAGLLGQPAQSRGDLRLVARRRPAVGLAVGLDRARGSLPSPDELRPRCSARPGSCWASRRRPAAARQLARAWSSSLARNQTLPMPSMAAGGDRRIGIADHPLVQAAGVLQVARGEEGVGPARGGRRASAAAQASPAARERGAVVHARDDSRAAARRLGSCAAGSPSSARRPSWRSCSMPSRRADELQPTLQPGADRRGRGRRRARRSAGDPGLSLGPDPVVGQGREDRLEAVQRPGRDARHERRVPGFVPASGAASSRPTRSTSGSASGGAAPAVPDPPVRRRAAGPGRAVVGLAPPRDRPGGPDASRSSRRRPTGPSRAIHDRMPVVLAPQRLGRCGSTRRTSRPGELAGAPPAGARRRAGALPGPAARQQRPQQRPGADRAGLNLTGR